MTSDALTFAALATAAIPGLRAEQAEAVRGRPGERFQVGFVEDAEHRRWVVRLPVDAVAAARQDATVSLLTMLARRLPFALPAPKGFAALRDGRQAMVYPLISGQSLDLTGLPPGAGLAAELGRALAALHNVDRRLFEEAAVPAYDASECRRRHLVLLDRGAQTGAVPVGLLSRWERLLDDVSHWRFAPTPVHGRLGGAHVLAAFDSPDDAASGRIRAVVGWEDAQVGDPAEDFAGLVSTASPEAVDTVLESYAMSRHERPDRHLLERAGLLAELRLLEDLLAATASKNRQAVAAATHALRRLDAEVGDPDAPRRPAPPDPAVDVTPAPVADERLYSAGETDARSRWVSEATPEDETGYRIGEPGQPSGLAWAEAEEAPAAEVTDLLSRRRRVDAESDEGAPTAAGSAEGEAAENTSTEPTDAADAADEQGADDVAVPDHDPALDDTPALDDAPNGADTPAPDSPQPEPPAQDAPAQAPAEAREPAVPAPVGRVVHFDDEDDEDGIPPHLR